MIDRSSLKIISVAGARSGVGKTGLCSILLENLPGFGAIKYTKTSLYASVVEDGDVINEPGKDTAVMAASGAQRVLWIKSPPDALDSALPMALEKMKALEGVVIEGNSPAALLDPHVRIFIIGPDWDMKPSAEAAFRVARQVVVNSKRNIDPPEEKIAIMAPGANIFHIDVASRQGETRSFLQSVKKDLA